MLKLIIADDERIIRETISTLIDWKSLGITLVGLAADGNEAYNMILDECPDIVLTDIKMPGLSGLELIEKTAELGTNAQFIILSGYSEFEYAKQAMEYGVRHYILKPCNEEQIIACMRKVIKAISEQIPFQKLAEETQLFASTMHHQLFINVIHDALVMDAAEKADGYKAIFNKYRKFADFQTASYEMFLLTKLDKSALEQTVRAVQSFQVEHAPSIFYSFVYVHHTLMLIFKSYNAQYPNLEQLLTRIRPDDPAHTHQSFCSLQALFTELLNKVSRYEILQYSDGITFTTIYNYKNLIQDIGKCAILLFDSDAQVSAQAYRTLIEQLAAVSDVHLLRQLTSSLLLLAASKSIYFTPLAATEFLIGIEQLADCGEITDKLFRQLEKIYTDYHSAHKTGEFSEIICNYIQAHIANPKLSLKWISDNVLFMNEDYVSRKFFKETGQKFSNYVTGVRIQKAKELLSHAEMDKIQTIAEQVGCGNNPQYFSQTFKKQTGLTPSGYIRMIRGNT